MTRHDGNIAGYRPAVGIMLLNSLGQVLVARRTDMTAMPDAAEIDAATTRLPTV